MMDPEISRLLARLKNYLGLTPGPQLDSLIRAAETCQSEDELPDWIQNSLRSMRADLGVEA